MKRVDWSAGRYEQIAEQLMPAAHAVVDQANPLEGERVVDLGCGTGNAALLAAERGARVTGVDPAPRLLEVARALAGERGLEATFAEGEGAAIPLGDGEADVVLSVFGVIFAPDAEAAAAEMARVSAPAGRIVLSAWIPEGTIAKLARAAREAVGRVQGGSGGSRPFAWQNQDALAGLFGPHGFAVETYEQSLAFTAESPRDHLETESEQHPLWIGARSLLEPRGEMEALRERALEILEAGNEDPDAFRATSRYVVVTALRS